MKTYYAEEELRYLLSIWQGRKIIFELINRCGVFSNPFTTERPALEFNCGSHAVGVEFLNDCMTISPKLTAMMIEEQGNYDNYRTDEQRTADAAGDDPDTERQFLGFDRDNGFGV